MNTQRWTCNCVYCVLPRTEKSLLQLHAQWRKGITKDCTSMQLCRGHRSATPSLCKGVAMACGDNNQIGFHRSCRQGGWRHYKLQKITVFGCWHRSPTTARRQTGAPALSISSTWRLAAGIRTSQLTAAYANMQYRYTSKAQLLNSVDQKFQQ